MKKRRMSRVFLLLLCCLLFSGILAVKLQYGNKYTSRPLPFQDGEVVFLGPCPAFLRDHWEFFQYQFLSPDQLALPGITPTTHLYIGQYGGFELDDPSASPHGAGTYRLRIRVEDEPRMYALELPQIYSSYSLWVNGLLMRSVDIPGQADPGIAAGPLVTFPAAGQVELVFAVRDESHLYSGLAYPPAFGTPATLSRLLILRTVLSAAICVSAALVGLFFLLIPLYIPSQRPLVLFAALCFCSACMVSREPFHMLGWDGDPTLIMERVGFYGAFSLLLILQSWLGRLPRPWVWLNSTLGLSLFAWSLLFPLLARHATANELIFYGNTLACYKLLVGALLFAGALYAVLRREPDSFCILVGSALFACALIADRLVPLYEPILLLWPIELAAYLQVTILFYILSRRTALVYQDNLLARELERSAQRLAHARLVQNQELVDHMVELRKIRHEILGFLLQLQYYLYINDRPALEQRLQEELGRLDMEPLFSNNGLVNALFSIYAAKAKRLGVQLEINALNLPRELGVKDTDLISILTNILDNAIDACKSVPKNRKKTISISISKTDLRLKIICSNTFCANFCTQNGFPCSTKDNQADHGLGLRIIRSIVGNYNGIFEWKNDKTVFCVCIILFPSNNLA